MSYSAQPARVIGEVYEPLPEFREELLAIEQELEWLWPGFQRVIGRRPSTEQLPAKVAFYALAGPNYGPVRRQSEGLAPLPPDYLKRLKWLRKRHELLMSGRDWGILMIQFKGRPGMWVTNPLLEIPGRKGPPHPPAPEPLDLSAADRARLWPHTAGAPQLAEAGSGTPDVHRIAFELNCDPRRVERALAAMPEGAAAVEWCRDWKEGT